MKGSTLSRLLRVAVTGVLVAWIVVTVEWGEFARTLAGTDLGYLALAVAVSPLLVLVNTWKWWILLRALGVPGPFGPCFRLYLLSKFFNNVLPTQVGGDVVRGVMLGRSQGKVAPALASVAAERVTGFAAMLVVILGVLAWDRGSVLPAFVFWGALGAAVALAGVVLLILSPRILSWVQGRAHLPLLGKLGRFQAAVQEFRGKRGPLFKAFTLSFAFYALAMANVLFAVRTFGAPLGPTEAVMATPVIMLIMLFPISVGGLGLAEWAYIFILGLYGVGSETALSAALLMRVKTALLGVVGGLLHMAHTSTSPRGLTQVAREPAAGAPGD